MRTHCFISTSRSDKGARWAWHAADDKGISTKSSEHLFNTFSDCVDDARAHGFHHVEVPVLDWGIGPVPVVRDDEGTGQPNVERERPPENERPQ